jgi:diacylglycerol kinase (ATP)
LKKFVVIVNGAPGKRRKFQSIFESELRLNFELETIYTKFPGEAVSIAEKVSEIPCDGILAAGGDGTVNELINGLFRRGKTSIPIGVIPIGTGNDFARHLGIKGPSDVIKRLHGSPQPIDVGRVEGYDHLGNQTTRYFLNVASAGMGPDVVKRLHHDSRWLGPDLTYLRATLKSFFGYQPEQITANWQGRNWSGKIRCLAVANGSSFGSGLKIAPEADPSDGSLNIFIAGDVSLPKFLFFLQRIKAGKKIFHPRAEYSKSKEITLHSEAEVWLETDGELACKLPAEFSVLKGALKYYC